MKKVIRRSRFWFLIGVGLIASYVCISLWWHARGESLVSDILPQNSFLGPPTGISMWPTDSPRDRLVLAGNRVFFDFAFQYRKLTHPFRYSWDLRGNAYFPPNWDRIDNDGYSRSGLLFRLGEPSLYAGPFSDSDETFFRLTQVFSKGECATCRITETLTATGLTIKARYASVDAVTGKLSQEETIDFPPEIWTSIRREVEAEVFWNRTIHGSRNFLPRTEWLFEYKASRGLHRELSIPEWQVFAEGDGTSYSEIAELIFCLAPFPITGPSLEEIFQ